MPQTRRAAQHDCSFPAALSSGACCSSPAVAARPMLNGLKVINLAHPRTQHLSGLKSRVIAQQFRQASNRPVPSFRIRFFEQQFKNTTWPCDCNLQLGVLPGERETVLISNSLVLCPVGESCQDEAVILAINTLTGTSAGRRTWLCYNTEYTAREL